MLRGPLAPAVLALAWPVLAALGVKVLFNLIDLYWVGSLGPAAIAALSTSAFLYWALLSLSEGLAVGTLALVARATGAGEPGRAAAAAAQARRWGTLAGILAGALLALGAGPAFALMKLPAEVAALGGSYIRVIALGAPVFFAFVAIDASLRGRGRPRASLGLLGGALLLNTLLDPLLIFGPGPFPALGVAGAAWATVLSFLAGALVGWLWLEREHRSRHAPPGAWLDRATGLRLLRIGAPMAANGVLFCSIYLLLTRIASAFGTPAIAALGIGHRVESLPYLTAVALESAAATIVGQCLGAGLVARARRGALAAVAAGSAVALASGSVMVAFPGALVRVFSDDPAVIAAGASYVRIVGLCQVFQAWEVILGGAFGGSGTTLPALLVGVPLTALRVPLAALLAGPLGLGVNGVFWAISASTTLKGVLLLGWWWRRGARGAGTRVDT